MSKRLITEAGLKVSDVDEMMKALGLGDEYQSLMHFEVSDAVWDSVPEIRKGMKYIGFDPKAIIQEFQKRYKMNPIVPGSEPSLVFSEKLMLHEKNDAHSDLLFFIVVFLERGNNVKKAMLRCEETARRVLQLKVNAYNIIDDTSTRTLQTSDLTLSRLAQAFNCHTASMIMSHEIPGKLISKLFRETPLLMQHTIFPSLIPQAGGFVETLRQIAVILNLEMSILLSKPKDKRKMMSKTLAELMEDSEMYVDAAINGSYSPTEARIRVLVKGKILVMTPTSGRPGFVLSEPLILMQKELLGISSRMRLPYTAVLEELAAERAEASPSGSTGSAGN